MTRKIRITRGKNQSIESHHKDLELAQQFLDDLFSLGVKEWKSHFRRYGRLKFMVAKEVGGPPWKFPRALFSLRHHIGVVVGWRMTAYHLQIHWRKAKVCST